MRSEQAIRRAGLVTLALVGRPAGADAQASFQGLGVLPGADHSYAMGVSADGQWASGFSGGINLLNRAFRWREGVMENLGIPPGAIYCEGGLINADGSVVVVTGGGQRPHRWTQATGVMQDLGLPAATTHLPEGISADGTIIAGAGGASPVSPRTFRWTSPSGWQYLPLPAGFSASWGGSMSAGGSIIVGTVFNTTDAARPVVWTNGAPTVLSLPAGHTEGGAFGISADGLVVTGRSGTSLVRHMFRWSQATGVQPLTALPSRGTAVNADGSVIVGVADFSGVPEAAIWTESTGLMSVGARLTSLGVNLAGWMLDSATGVSADGLTIVGLGTHDGRPEGWIARMPGACYADCNGDVSLTVADFGCFQTAFISANPYADCNQSGTLTIADFGCFQTKYALGCP
ncbi:MAG: PEP-CTERM sorting domain-containing protein [Phycisphaerales bacterium]